MSGPLRLLTYRDEMADGLVVILTDDTRYAKNIMTDEELTRTPDLLEYQKWFLEKLCSQWYELFREKVRCIPPESEGQEWTIIRSSDEVIEGEIVTNELPAGLMTAEDLMPLLLDMRNIPNPYAPPGDDVIEGEVVENAERPAIEGGGH